MDIARILFYTAISITILVYGVFAGKHQLFPYAPLDFIEEKMLQAFEEREMLAGTKPVLHIHRARYPGNGVVTNNRENQNFGLTLISSFFGDGLEIRLFDEKGKVLNQWPVRVFDIWENLDHIEPESKRPKSNWNAFLNGVVLLPDGSIVFNHFGLVKMDRCGKILWKVPRLTHHSVEHASDGGFWVGARRFYGDRSRHLPVRVPYYEETILKVSDNGQQVEEISILDLLIENDLRSELFANNRQFISQKEQDVTHLNDIEELSDELAKDFSDFNAGDLLVSLREPNMVLVVDPESRIVKWYQVGPWIQHHDPDFQPNGKISVFDNNYDTTWNGSFLGGSKITELELSTGKIRNLYGGVDSQPMYTTYQGDHQILPNGNILITESTAGRVVEVTSDGDVVWEFINQYAEGEVLLVSDALRYDRSYFSDQSWTCNNNNLN